MMLLLARYLGLAVEAPTGGDSFGDSDDDDDSCARLSTRSSNDINSGNKCSENRNCNSSSWRMRFAG